MTEYTKRQPERAKTKVDRREIKAVNKEEDLRAPRPLLILLHMEWLGRGETDGGRELKEKTEENPDEKTREESRRRRRREILGRGLHEEKAINRGEKLGEEERGRGSSPSSSLPHFRTQPGLPFKTRGAGVHAYQASLTTALHKAVELGRILLPSPSRRPPYLAAVHTLQCCTCCNVAYELWCAA